MRNCTLLAAILGLACFVPLANAQDKKTADSRDRKAPDFRWETVAEEDRDNTITKRARVPGGWLYKVQSQSAMALTFVPDRPPERAGFPPPVGGGAGGFP